MRKICFIVIFIISDLMNIVSGQGINHWKHQYPIMIHGEYLGFIKRLFTTLEKITICFL